MKKVIPEASREILRQWQAKGLKFKEREFLVNFPLKFDCTTKDNYSIPEQPIPEGVTIEQAQAMWEQGLRLEFNWHGFSLVDDAFNWQGHYRGHELLAKLRVPLQPIPEKLLQEPITKKDIEQVYGKQENPYREESDPNGLDPHAPGAKLDAGKNRVPLQSIPEKLLQEPSTDAGVNVHVFEIDITSDAKILKNLREKSKIMKEILGNIAKPPSESDPNGLDPHAPGAKLLQEPVDVSNATWPASQPTSFSTSLESDPNGLDPHAPGAKLDAGKNRLGLVLGGFARALEQVGRVGTGGAVTYSDNGWKEVDDGIARYEDAMLRHWVEIKKGNAQDPKTGLLHQAHLAWNALAVLELMLKETK